MVRLRLDPDQVDEVRDYALRQGIETIRNRVDKLGVAEPTIIKKGTDIIVELPGLKPADFERIKIDHRPHRAARVQDRRRRLGVHEEGRAAMPARPEGGVRRGIEVGTDGWTEKDSGKSHEDVYLRVEEPRRAARSSSPG